MARRLTQCPRKIFELGTAVPLRAVAEYVLTYAEFPLGALGGLRTNMRRAVRAGLWLLMARTKKLWGPLHPGPDPHSEKALGPWPWQCGDWAVYAALPRRFHVCVKGREESGAGKGADTLLSVQMGV